MKTLFYQEFYKNRLNKVLSIFGKDWFAGKKILELGACYGDIGIELMRLGADVTFSDLRKDNLDEIEKKLSQYNVKPKCIQINQENSYNLKTKFDLTLHLGILYNLENWKQDLECAINHSDITILESKVNHLRSPDVTRNSKDYEVDWLRRYMGEKPILTLVCQESIEAHLKKLGCKFVRFDNVDLNTNFAVQGINDGLIKFLYDWNYENSKNISDINVKQNRNINFRRFWLILK